MMQAQYDQMAKAADVGVGITAASAASAIHTTNDVVQILAGIVAIVAGVATAVFHIQRILHMKRHGKGE